MKEKKKTAKKMDKMPLLFHFEELLKRFKRAFLWVLLGSAAGYFFAETIYEGLREPLVAYLSSENPLVYTRFFEKVGVLFRIALVAGLLIASPLLGFEVLAFVRPALKEIERKRMRTLIVSFVLCFVAGSLVGYFYILPFIIKTVLSFGSADLLPMLTVSSYVNASIGIILMSALFFEIPAVMLNLSLWGWVRASTWSRGRRLSIVINAIVSAFLSPPDPWSMLLMMIPLHVLFECGIILAKVGERISGLSVNREGTCD